MSSWKRSHFPQDEEEAGADGIGDEEADEDHEFISPSVRSSSQRYTVEDADEEDEENTGKEDEENTDEEDEDDELEDHSFNTNDSAEFSVALQELKSIRSHLYSAAEYCESAYIHSDQKQAIFENLKDYSVKALVNAVDHVGTVASKLNDLVVKRTQEISLVELNISCLSQRFQTCHDSAICEGLNHYQRAKRRPRYGQHYALADVFPGDAPKIEDKGWIIVKKTSETRSILSGQVDAVSDTFERHSLGWYLASEAPSVSSSQSTPAVPNVNRSTSSNFRGDKKVQGFLPHSLSGGQRNLSPFATFNHIHEQVESPAAHKSLTPLFSLDETKQRRQSRKKGLLSTFLGRTKSGKPPRLSTSTSFKE